MNLHLVVSNDLPSIMQIGEVYQRVVDYLTPLELYNLTNTCHMMHANQNLDVMTVVKVALFNGNTYTKTTIENIYHQLLSNAIFMPSIHRLLLLTVIKSCELCRNNKIHYVTNFGLAFCITCRQSKTISCYMKPPRKLLRSVEINDLLQHPSVLSITHHFERETSHKFSPKHPVSYVLEKPAFDGNRNQIGPVITNRDLNFMLTLPNYKRVEDYISSQQPASLCRDDFINAVNMYREVSYIARVRRKMKNCDQWKTYRKKKLKNALQALVNLMEYIPPGITYYFRHRINETYLGYKYASNEVCIQMYNAFVRHKLRPLLRSPSRYLTTSPRNNEQKLLDLARIICRHFSARPNQYYAATW